MESFSEILQVLEPGSSSSHLLCALSADGVGVSGSPPSAHNCCPRGWGWESVATGIRATLPIPRKQPPGTPREAFSLDVASQRASAKPRGFGWLAGHPRRGLVRPHPSQTTPEDHAAYNKCRYLF